MFLYVVSSSEKIDYKNASFINLAYRLPPYFILNLDCDCPSELNSTVDGGKAVDGLV